jgi:hypothetical protein
MDIAQQALKRPAQHVVAVDALAATAATDRIRLLRIPLHLTPRRKAAGAVAAVPAEA